MNLSTKGRYGVRMMVELALAYGQGTIMLKDIASRQEISEKYLWHLISSLKKGGYVRSMRGPKGGYALTKNPKDVSLKDILAILEGPLALVDCADETRTCARSSGCEVKEIWAEITEKMSSILEEYTLQDIIDRINDREETIHFEI